MERKAIKRKFPGPAGLLPDRKQLSCEETDENQDIPCTQTSLAQFESEIWAKMCCDFGSNVQNFNISWIKQQANRNKLRNYKAPFVAALIERVQRADFKVPSSNVNVALLDKTGRINGTFTNSLHKRFSDFLKVGSVVVLKDFGVLTVNQNHSLMITVNNLVNIYSAGDTSVKITKVRPIETHENSVKTSENTDSELFQDALEGIDINSLFEDF